MFRFRSCGLVVFALARFVFFPVPAKSQQLDPNGLPIEKDPAPDAGCPPLKIFWPLHAASVLSCQRASSVEVVMPLKPDARGYSQEKRVRGNFEFRQYKIPEAEQEYAFDSLLNQLPMAGFKVKYAMKPSTITARKDDIWILINVSGDLYNVNVVQEPPQVWQSPQTAQEISKEMQAHGRAEIYGILFSPADQSIVEDKSQILLEVQKYLQENRDISVVIESHKISNGRQPEDDSEITRERANAVMDWLIAHGISRARLQPRPCGRDNPLTDNETPSEIQRNERITLVRPPSHQ